ncbi:MAG: hypothetical protein JWL75_449 [Parcubacteria group bacterium]|nr:hypothetical protein [Parcubacteria group bacterium]
MLPDSQRDAAERVYMTSVTGYESPYGFMTDPKVTAFFKEFPFINGTCRKLWQNPSGIIEPKVQRIDDTFLQEVIEPYKWWVRLAYGGDLTGAVLLDQDGDILATVGTVDGRRVYESVYATFRRIGPEDIARVAYAFFYENRGRIPLLAVYKTPKNCSLLDFLDDYEMRQKAKVLSQIAEI